MKPKRWERLALGETWRGFWDDDVPSFPILAARGAHDGPTFLVTGGVHGDEYEGPAAIWSFFRNLDVCRLSGTVLGLPVVNRAAWEARSRVAPDDGVDLNRVFPGRSVAGSTSTQHLAEIIFDAFVRRCDVLVDMHSGGKALMHSPLVGWYAIGSGEAERLARYFGRALQPWIIPNVPGVLSYEAHRLGKIAVGTEWGGGACLDPIGVNAYEAGLHRMLVALAMTEPFAGEMPIADDRPGLRGDYQKIEANGLWIPAAKLGDQVAKGATLGEVHDLLGTVVASAGAARDGTVAGLAHNALVHSGDRVAYIG